MVKILSRILIGLFIISILAFITVLVVRYVLLDMAVSQIDKAYKSLRQQAVQGMQNNFCYQDTNSDNSGPVTYQLRFITPETYVLETVCFQRQLDGHEFLRFQLPKWTSRSGGSIGVIAFQSAEPMQIEVFNNLIQTLPQDIQLKLNWLIGRTTIVFQDNNAKEIEVNEKLPPWLSTGVRSNCQAFGYTCCDARNQVGTDLQMNDTTDCAGRCFARCLDRPLVISFGADGSFDPMARTVEVLGEADLNFSYVGQPGSSPLKSAIINFGDNQTATLNSGEVGTTHRYQCRQPVCIFTASITLIDESGIESAQTPLTELKISIRN